MGFRVYGSRFKAFVKGFVGKLHLVQGSTKRSVFQRFMVSGSRLNSGKSDSFGMEQPLEFV